MTTYLTAYMKSQRWRSLFIWKPASPEENPVFKENLDGIIFWQVIQELDSLRNVKVTAYITAHLNTDGDVYKEQMQEFNSKFKIVNVHMKGFR